MVETERKRKRNRKNKSRSRKRSDSEGAAGLLFPHLRGRGRGLDCSGYAEARFEFTPMPMSARLATSSFTCMDLVMGPEQRRSVSVSSMSFPRWQMVGAEYRI